MNSDIFDTIGWYSQDLAMKEMDKLATYFTSKQFRGFGSCTTAPADLATAKDLQHAIQVYLNLFRTQCMYKSGAEILALTNSKCLVLEADSSLSVTKDCPLL